MPSADLKSIEISRNIDDESINVISPVIYVFTRSEIESAYHEPKFTIFERDRKSIKTSSLQSSEERGKAQVYTVS